jgi:hypothetical protein
MVGLRHQTPNERGAPQVKKDTPSLRASHVNHGTSFAGRSSGGQSKRGPMLRHPKLHLSSEASDTTAYGGLALAAGLVRSLGIARDLNRDLSLLASHRPFHESDHVLTHVYNLYAGGTCIEDISDLQTSEPVRRILGTDRIPDPTTAGDFLRRFDDDSLRTLDQVIDQAQEKVWRRRYGKKKADRAIVDLDSCVRPVYGHQKEGTDFTYKGSFGYHPLVISLAGTMECLRLINRSGNEGSASGSETHLRELFPMLDRRFKQVIVRGDSAFSKQAIFDACEEAGHFFAVVSPQQPNFASLFEALAGDQWKPYRQREENPEPPGKHRTRGPNRRQQRARARNKRDLQLEKQWIAELPYQPDRGDHPYRLIARYQEIEENEQGHLFKLTRFRYVLSNLPPSVSAEEVIDLTYQRCDQENLIEQLQSGLAGMRMPTGGFRSNAAFLTCGRLAHNLKPWLAQLALPKETMRWEWKRFRRAFVYCAARVVHTGRQIHVRFADSHRFAGAILAAHLRLQV